MSDWPRPESPPTGLSKPISQRQLSPWDPLDHLRLLWWILVNPQQLRAYRGAFGNKDERRVGTWLTGTLTWLPLLILTLALGPGTLPRTEAAYLSTIYLWISAGLAMGWVLTGWIGKSNIEAFEMAGVVALCVVFVVARAVVSHMALGVAGIVALVVALVVPLVVAFAVAGNVEFIVARGVAGCMTFAAVGLVASIVVSVVSCAKDDVVCWAGIVAPFMTAGALEVFVVRSLKTGRPSWPARAAFGALVLAHAFLVWFSFLGGWRVFQ